MLFITTPSQVNNFKIVFVSQSNNLLNSLIIYQNNIDFLPEIFSKTQNVNIINY